MLPTTVFMQLSHEMLYKMKQNNRKYILRHILTIFHGWPGTQYAEQAVLELM